MAMQEAPSLKTGDVFPSFEDLLHTMRDIAALSGFSFRISKRDSKRIILKCASDKPSKPAARPVEPTPTVEKPDIPEAEVPDTVEKDAFIKDETASERPIAIEPTAAPRCAFHLRAITSASGSVHVTTLHLGHTCDRSQRSSQVQRSSQTNHRWLVEKIRLAPFETADISAKDIQAYIETEYGVQLPYSTAHKVKDTIAVEGLSPPPSSQRRRICRNCRQMGHNRRTCTNAPVDLPETEMYVPRENTDGSMSNKRTVRKMCGNCGRIGHNRRTCKNDRAAPEGEADAFEMHDMKPMDEKVVDGVEASTVASAAAQLGDQLQKELSQQIRAHSGADATDDATSFVADTPTTHDGTEMEAVL